MIKKQETKNTTLDLSAIGDIDRKVKKTSSEKSENVKFNIVISHEAFKSLYALQFEYSKQTEKFNNLSMNSFFSTAVLFVEDAYRTQNILKTAPRAFVELITRRGKRKRHDRYKPVKESKKMHLSVSSVCFEKYINIMYSFLEHNSKDIYDQTLSLSYFFYDVLDYLKKHKKQLFQFNS